MREKIKNQKSKIKNIVFIFLLVTGYLSLVTASYAKVYIDITSPAFRKLPISISYTGTEEAGKVAQIVTDDLDFTGLFYPQDPGTPGAEIKIKIDVLVADQIMADVLVLDMIANETILIKRYNAPKKIMRTLAHTLSNDIFKVITGKDGAFRTKLSYIVNSSNKKWLYLTDWDGYNSVRVVSKGLSFSHSWSNDGLKMIFSSERNKRWGIYSLNLKNFKEKKLFLSKGLNLVGDVSTDNLIAFSSSKDGSPEIYTMNIKGRGFKKLTKSFGIDLSPTFSPDGSQIAFVSDRGGSPQIYVMDSTGKGARRLTFQGSYNTSPSWSPDGRWIAYVGRIYGKNQIFVIKSDSTDLRQLTEDGNNENPTFSPDAMFIAFDSDRHGSKAIYLMSMNSGHHKRITRKGMKAMYPEWSPYIK